MREAVLVCLLATAVWAGTVRRDPVTGKWIEVDANNDAARPLDSRASGGDGGGFFGGLSFVDNRAAPAARDSAAPDNDLLGSFEASLNAKPEALPRARRAVSEQSVVHAQARTRTEAVASSRLTSRDRPSKSSKFTREVPMSSVTTIHPVSAGPSRARAVPAPRLDDQTLVQAQAQAQVQAQLEARAAVGVQAPSVVERVVHPVPDQQADIQLGANAPLQVRTIGNLCRFNGYAPLSGCPVEVQGGCVDRMPCERQCKQDGFFSWRCAGPALVSPDEYVPEPEPPAPRPVVGTDEFVNRLAARIELALENGDYSALARAIVDTNMAASRGAASSAAASSLLQRALEAQAKHRAQL